MVLLGLRASRRERLLRTWERAPAWASRLTGVVAVTLAVRLALDLLRR